MNTCLWLIRREFWENRAIWMIPAMLGAALILAALFGRVDVEIVSSDRHRVNAEMVLIGFGVVFYAVMSLYSTWYLLDCLYADRRDRSVLFWKSLPISDTTTVLSKLFIALIAIPLVCFAAVDLASVLVAFIVSLRTRGFLDSALWQPEMWLALQVLWLYVIVSAAVWYLPLTCWLLVVSAWAKRAVMLWSILPPLAAILAERLFLGTHAVSDLLHNRMSGYFAVAFHAASQISLGTTSAGSPDTMVAPSGIWALLDPLGFFSSPSTWAGVLVGATLVFGAIQLRMRRTEP